MISPEMLTMNNVLVFIIFLVIVVLIYKIFRIALRAALIVAAGFAFPWIVAYLGLPLPITPDIGTGIRFAAIALAIFLIYQFGHFIIHFFKLLLWPFRRGKR